MRSGRLKLRKRTQWLFPYLPRECKLYDVEEICDITVLVPITLKQLRIAF